MTNPATQEVLCQVPYATPAELDQAVQGAMRAYETWRDVPTPERARLMLKYQEVLKARQEDIARVLSRETGKTHEDAMGEVWRGIEVVEHACNIPNLVMGELVENVARRIDTYSIVQPLGVCAGITPFNFPAMIPLWMFPIAVACGNAFVLKPSEQDPMTPMFLMELLAAAGAPEGIVQVCMGGREQVDGLLAHPDIKAGELRWLGARRQACLSHRHECAEASAGAGGSEEPPRGDAGREPQQTISSLVGAACGAAGQRCMAISAAVLVGDAKDWEGDLAAAMAAVRPGVSDDPAAGYGPQISVAARERILGYIAAGKAEGARCVLDGSECRVDGYPDGNWVGPTLFADVAPEMSIYRDEIFGPVLVALAVDTLDDAIDLINASPFGNGVSLFTSSGASARKFQHEIGVGQVGINVPIPVPLPFFSFTGWKDSFFGDLHAYGKQAVRFYTETKTVTARWFDDPSASSPNMTIGLR